MGVKSSILLLMAVVPLFAATTYTSRAEWQKNIGNEVLLNYEGASGTAIVPLHTGLVAGPFEVLGYAGGTPTLQGVGPDASPYYFWNTGATLLVAATAPSKPRIRINYSGDQTAVGLYVMTGNLGAQPVRITVNGTTTYDVSTTPRPTPTWWGLVDSGSIHYIEIGTDASNLQVDYLSAGTALAEIPEPGSMALAAAGLLSLGLLRRRRSH